MYLFYSMLYKECTTGYVICMYRIYSERKCIDGDFMNVSMMICVYLVLILSTGHTRVVLQGIIHVCNFFFNHNVYKMILHVFSSWVCDLLDIMKINLSNNANVMTQQLLLTTFMQPKSVIHQSNVWIERKNGGHLHFRNVDLWRRSV